MLPASSPASRDKKALVQLTVDCDFCQAAIQPFGCCLFLKIEMSPLDTCATSYQMLSFVLSATHINKMLFVI